MNFAYLYIVDIMFGKNSNTSLMNLGSVFKRIN